MLSPRRNRRAICLAAACAGVATLVPATASAGSLAEQVLIRPPEKSPVTVPGADLEKGDRVRSGELLIGQPYTIGSGEKLVARFTCPGRKKNWGLGFQGLTVDVIITNSAYGKKTQRVTLRAADKPTGGTYSGAVYSRCSRHSKPKVRKGCRVPAGSQVLARTDQAVTYLRKTGEREAVLYGCARRAGRIIRLWKCDPGQLTSDTLQSVSLRGRTAKLEIERKPEASETYFHLTRRWNLRTGKRSDTRSPSRPQPAGVEPVFTC